MTKQHGRFAAAFVALGSTAGWLLLLGGPATVRSATPSSMAVTERPVVCGDYRGSPRDVFFAGDTYGAGLIAVVGSTVVVPRQFGICPNLQFMDYLPDQKLRDGVRMFTAGRIGDVATHGGYLYYTDEAGLHVVDASDPDAPVVVADAELGWCLRMDVGEDLAVVLGWQELYIVDVSEARAPVLVTTLPVSGYRVAVGQRVAVVVGTQGTAVYDLSTPSAPVRGADLDYGSIDEVAIKGHIGVFGVRRGPTLVVDLSDPHHPVTVASLGTTTSTRRVRFDGSVAYIANGLEGLDVYELSRPSRPEFLARIGTRVGASDVGLLEDFAFVAGVTGIESSEGGEYVAGMGIFDLVERATVRQIADVPGVYARSLAADGNLLGGVARNKLNVIDISDVDRPRLLGSLDVPAWTPRIAMGGGRAFVGDYGFGSGRLSVVDLSDPQTPRTVIYEPSTRQVLALALYPATMPEALYLGGPGGVDIYDVTDDDALTLVGSIPVSGLADVRIVNGHLVVGSPSIGLQLFDLEDPFGPTLVGTSTEIRGYLGPSEGALQMVGDGEGFRIVDLTNPSMPRVRGESDSIRMPVAWRDSFAYTRGSQSRVVDLSDLSRPRELATFNAGDVGPALVHGGVLYSSLYSADRPAGPLRVVPLQCERTELRPRDPEPGLFADVPGFVRTLGNPFAGEISLEFALERTSTVAASVFDIAGRRVRTFSVGRLPLGVHTLRWNGRDDQGALLAAGAYFFRITVDDRPPDVVKVVLVSR